MASFRIWFRGLHIAVQIAAWLLFFPVVAALAITRGQREPIGRVVAALVVLLLTTPIWLAAAFGGSTSGDNETAEPPPTEEMQDVAPEPAPESAPDTTTQVEAEPEPAVDETEADSSASEGGARLDEAPALEDQPQPPPQPDASSNQARAPLEETAEGVLVSTLLAQLTVAPEEPGGYDRDLFPHWITRNGCTTLTLRSLVRPHAARSEFAVVPEWADTLVSCMPYLATVRGMGHMYSPFEVHMSQVAIQAARSITPVSRST